jgi:hypothetical protein
MASAGCYRNGTPGGPIASLGLNGVSNFCTAVQGFFAAGQIRSRCVGARNGATSWVFDFKNQGKGGNTLAYQYCVDSIKKQINGCSNGGDQGEGDWYFRYDFSSSPLTTCLILDSADPNNGACSDADYIDAHPNGEPPRAKRAAEVSNNQQSSEAESMLRFLQSVADDNDEEALLWDLEHSPTHEELHGLYSTGVSSEKREEVPEIWDLKYSPSHEELHGLTETRRDAEVAKKVASTFKA